MHKEVKDYRDVWEPNVVKVSDGWVSKFRFDGKDFNSEAEAKAYIKAQEQAGVSFDSYAIEDLSYEEFHEEDRGKMKTVEVGSHQEVSHYVCSGCGERKPA